MEPLPDPRTKAEEQPEQPAEATVIDEGPLCGVCGWPPSAHMACGDGHGFESGDIGPETDRSDDRAAYGLERSSGAPRMADGPGCTPATVPGCAKPGCGQTPSAHVGWELGHLYVDAQWEFRQGQRRRRLGTERLERDD